jgi:hypothetical protein
VSQSHRPKVEIVNYPTRTENGWYPLIQLAIDGTICVPFDELVENRSLVDEGRLHLPNLVPDDPWLDYLAGRAVALIGMFGDARYPKPFELDTNEAAA